MKHYIKYFMLLILSASCSNQGNEEQTMNTEQANNSIVLTPQQIKNAGVKVSQLAERPVSELLKVNGKIDVPPQNMVSVSVPLGGFLKSTQLLPGMHVKKGEVIAVMEDQQYIQLQQDYLSAKARAGYLKYEYERQKELNKDKACSDKVLQQTESEYLSCKINLKALSEKLKLIHLDPEQLNEGNISRTVKIPAPIDGFVSVVNVNIGKYVNPSDVLFELVNPNDIHLNLTVYEKDVEKLFIGQKLKAYTNSNPDKLYDCDILLIGQNISNESNVEVHCHFMNYDKSLIPGMYMNAEIKCVKRKALTVNSEAVVSFENRNGVFALVKENVFEWVEVMKGLSENGFIEIKNPEKLEGKKIVSTGAYVLLMELKNRGD